MPRKPSMQSGDDYVLPAFVRCDLTDDEKEQCKKNLVACPKAVERIEDLVSDGYKISFAWDVNSDCYSGFLTATDRQRVNKGQALSARAPTLQGLLTVLFFKHYERLKENWSANGSNAAFSSWG